MSDTVTTSRSIPMVVLANALGVVTAACVLVTAIGSFQEQGTLDDLFGNVAFLVLLGVTLVVGWLLAIRLPRHPVGWILLAIPALFTLSAPLSLIQMAVHTSVPSAARWIAWYNGTNAHPSWSWLPPVWLLLSQLPLRFPSGRLPSPRWTWFSWFSFAALVVTATLIGTGNKLVSKGVPNPAHVAVIADHVSVIYPVGFALLAVAFAGSIASLFVRYRGATVRERAQLRWMLWSVAISVLGLILVNLLPRELGRAQGVVLVLYSAVPIAVAVAVLRYRLYEIDRIISRTAAYAIVTLVVIGTYAAVVLLVGLIPGLSGSGIGVALATLAAAAVFLPVLHAMRRLIDRVFNRSQYNAERVVEAFGVRIRNGADPHAAGVDLLSAVTQTLQPTTIGLWSRDGAR